MAEDRVTLNLRVLSPSSEVEGGIHLQDLPTSTTVRELRLKIQDAVASRPGPERMRLIYRGKVVANDSDTLETVFGTEELRESKDQSLHLVLRELPQVSSTSSTPVPRIASAPPNPSQPAAAGPPLQTNPFRAIPQPRPNSQPQAGPQPQPQPHHHHHHHAHHPHVHHHHHVQQPLNPLGPLGAMPLPPQMQHQLAQAMGRQRVAAAALGTPAPGTPVQAGDTAAPQPAPAEGDPAQTPPPPPPPPPAPPLAPGMIPGFGGMPAPNGRVIRQDTVDLNGARWSVTYNDFTANIPVRPGQPTMPRPVPLPAAFGLPPRPFGSPPPGGVNVPLSWLLPRLRGTLQEAAREVDNVRTLLDPSAVEGALSNATGTPTFPSWRAERIREHLRTITHNLNMVDGGLSDPAMQLNMDVIVLRQAAGEVRRQANEFSAMLDAREAGVSAELAQSTSPGSSTAAASDPLVATASAATRTLPFNAPQELFLLSSPQGPVGVLFDQQGTYTTAPFTSALPPQPFVDQFTQNRQLIASLGQQIAQSAQHLRGHLAGAQPTPTPTQQPGQAQPAQQPEAFDQAAAQHVIQNIVQNRNERQAGAQPANLAAPAENDRVANIAGHLWLVFKLACFVYIFAGGGGWYRPLMLGSIAVIVYIVQLGIFEAQLNVVRQHFEALLPNADRLAQGGRANNNPANANAAAATGDARRNAPVTPEEAARRLLLQQRNNQFGWARDAMRTLERGVALFVASLWPGIGERMVHAQEERERLARVAASEERERQEEEEERRRREEGEEEASRQGEAKLDEGVQAGEKQSAVQSSSAPAEKPPLDRLPAQTLSRDFMDKAAPGEGRGGEGEDEVGDEGRAGSGLGKGKERAV